jgi:peptide-methionine (S)-S-oxide reductase
MKLKEFVMMSLAIKLTLLIAMTVAIGCGIAASSGNTAGLKEFAPAEIENTGEAQKGIQTAVFAGGCFWGVEAVFERVKGVSDARSGYAGGDARSANYEAVSGGTTQHAEAVIVEFDPSKVSYTQLLSVFFSVVHDPTEVNRQGPDIGPQYRSAIFYSNGSQRNAAAAYIDAINSSKALNRPVATQVVPLEKFYEAEKYHQNYLDRNPTQPYIVMHDLPKIEALKAKFPELYNGK